MKKKCKTKQVGVSRAIDSRYEQDRHVYWYDYINPKYVKKAKLCDIDVYSFLVNVKSGCIYADLAGAVKKTFDASNYEAKKSLPQEETKRRLGC